jgi:hypothetical protein
MTEKHLRTLLYVLAAVLTLLSLAVGGFTQYVSLKALRAGVGKHAYGKPSGFGAREFKPPGVYVGRVAVLKIYTLPSEGMDIPGWQMRYRIRRETADGQVYEADFSTDLFDLRDDPPADAVTSGFPPLGYLDVVHKGK